MDFDFESGDTTYDGNGINAESNSYDSYNSSTLNASNINSSQTTTTTFAAPMVPILTSTKKPRKKLTTDQIIAIVLVLFIVAGIVVMVLGFVGVFNSTSPAVSLTPVLTTPLNLPVTVAIS